MAESTFPLVLVTGASSFIGSHIIKLLQTQGKYAVRGTVRSLQNKEKIETIKGLVPDASHPLELVEADLNKEEGWKEAVEGCTFVCHVASPVPISNPTDENEIINPAVNGTLYVLRACAEVGTVKRVVLTSSVTAIGINDAPQDPGHLFTESDWTQVTVQGLSAYIKSKVRAERAAWDFVEKLEDDKKFELAVVNPSWTFGPCLMKSSSASTETIRLVLSKQISALPDIHFAMIDVRDCAAAHIAAMEVPEAAGHRHILVERYMTFKEIAELVSQEFTPQGYSIPSMTLPKFIVWTLKFFSADMEAVYAIIGKRFFFDTKRMQDVLKITEPLDSSKAVIDTCYSLIETGLVPKTPGYLGPLETRK